MLRLRKGAEEPGDLLDLLVRDLVTFISEALAGAEQEDPGLQTGDESGAALLI